MQNKVGKVDLAYLAALWDGEGTFSVQRTKTGFWVRSSLSNTNLNLFNRVKELLNKMEISPYIVSRKRRENWKESFELSVNRQADNRNLLEGLLPFLSGKRPVAEIVSKFVIRRLSLRGSVNIVRDIKGKIVTSKKSNVYINDDIVDYEAIRNLNKKKIYSNDLLQSQLDRNAPAETDMAYLAGIVDGEGSFLIKKKVSGNRLTFKPSCVIANCNTTLLNKCIQILNDLGIAYQIRVVKRKNDWAICYNIEIEKVKDIFKLAGVILPYLSGKKDVVRLVMQFAKSRIEQKLLFKNHRHMAYTESEVGIYQQVRKLNQRGLRLPAEQSVEKQFRELLERPNVVYQTRVISNQVPKFGKGSETISQESKLEAIAS